MKENNILLAEFLGWEQSDNNKSRFKATQPYYITAEEIDFDFRNIVEVDVFETAFDDMKFSEDWNWLMLVVEKIESLGFETSLTDKTFFIRIGGSNTQAGIMYTNKIEAVYNSCVEFIKWYNKDK